MTTDTPRDRGRDGGPRLVDQDARDRVRDDVDATLLLEAGAGTGKTTLLVDRILSLVGRKGVPVERIVAITFTVKAAAEMRVRLREKLETAAAGAGRAGVGGEWPPAARARFARAASDLPLATLSTIHAFAESLLRERPVEAGVDPGFTVLDEIAMKALRDEVWTRWEEAELVARAEPYRRALYAGVTRRRVLELADDLIRRRDVDIADAIGPAGVIDVDAEIAALGAALDEVRALARGACRVRGDTLVALLDRFAEGIAALAAAPANQREARLARFPVPSAAMKGNRDDWDHAALECVREATAGLRARVARAAALCGERIAGDVARWLGGFTDAYESEKARRGVLDFDDLLILARNLLRARLDVRDDLAGRFDALLVDEFQDTDPLQAEILIRLAASREDVGESTRRGDAGAPHTREWLDADIAPGRLFVVGDPKQSIYRFRRADIDAYTAVRDRICRGDSPLRITQNFRSVPGIASWVNGLFEGLFAPTDDALSQADFAPIVPQRGATGGEPPVLVLAPPPDIERGLSADDVRALEAEAIGDAVAAEIAEGWALPGDVAVLFRAMKDILPYEEAFESRGIPFQVEEGKAFFARDEVHALLACLSAIDDPEDTLALVAALRSPHFGISDDDLALLVAERRPLRYLDDPGASHPAIAEAFSTLCALHARRQSLPLHRVVDAVVEETRALEFHALREGGRRAVANLRKVAEKARAYEAGGAPTLRAFVRWLAEEALESAEGDSPLAEDRDGLVTFVTIHKAKGLEYPVVAVANLHGGSPFKETFLVDGLARRAAFTLGNKESPLRSAGFTDLREREKKRHREEERRLLYVATTRARDRLILPAHAALLGKETSALSKDLLTGLPPPEAWRDGAIVDGVRIMVSPRGADAIRARRPVRSDPARDAAALARLDDEAWSRARHRGVERGSAPLPIITSRRLHAPHRVERSARDAETGAYETADAGAPAVTLGRFVHAVLEALPDLDAERIDATIDAVAAALGWGGPAGSRDVPRNDAVALRAEARDLVLAIVADPALARARRAPRFIREAPFSVRLGERLAEGTIDLLFEEEGEVVLVDYKTDRVGGGAPDESRLEAHADSRGHIDQAALYAQAVHAATGRAVREAVLVYSRARAALSIAGARLMARPLPDPFPAGDGEEAPPAA